MWKIIIPITLLCALWTCANAGNALGPCAGGRGVPVVPTGSGGACGFPDGANGAIPTVNLNQAFFGDGSKCGECYEVTGPLGTITVMVTDMCGSSSPKCGGDKDNFGIQQDAYAHIANATTTDIIYDLGYRRVTCDVSGNIKAQVGTDMNDYYFTLVVYNTLIGVTAVGVKCSGWNNFEALSRNNARWTWNKNNQVFGFPLTLSIVGENGQVIQYKVSSFKGGDILDFGSQFPQVPAGNGLCPLAMPPASIYNGSLNYGWSTTYSFGYKSLPVSDATNPRNGNPSLFADLYGYGGLQFTRNGGFASGYFTTLQFDVRSNNGAATLRVYFGELASGQTGGVTLQNQVTNNWQTFNISISDLQPQQVEYYIVFQNFDINDAQFWFANVQFSLAPATNNPLTNVTYTTSTTSTGNANNSSATSAGGANSGSGTTGSSTGSANTGLVGGSGIVSTTAYNFDTSTSTGSTSPSTGSGSGNSSSSGSVLTYCSFMMLFAFAILLC